MPNRKMTGVKRWQPEDGRVGERRCHIGRPHEGEDAILGDDRKKTDAELKETGEKRYQIERWLEGRNSKPDRREKVPMRKMTRGGRCQARLPLILNPGAAFNIQAISSSQDPQIYHG